MIPVPEKQSRELSPVVLDIAQRMATGSDDYLKQNIARIMNDSAKLAEEPEFADLYLDGEKAFQLTGRWLKKYEKRLETAEKKGPEEYRVVSDEMRIEIVSELAVPAFRTDVEQRLQTLLNRLFTGSDGQKLEMVMVLGPALRMKNFPWGLCGLVLAIYNRTMLRVIQERDEDRSVFNAVVEALKAEGEEKINIFTVLKHPAKLEEIGKKIFEEQPGLRQRAEKQIWDMVEAFEAALGRGDVDLSLFSEEELVLPFQRLQAELSESSIQEQPPEETRERFGEAIRQAVIEIMTPERFRRFREDIERTATLWLRKRQKWGPALQVELSYLNGDQYEENKFVLMAFIGQIYRRGKTLGLAKKK